ncbi:MAG: hypothetical protein Q7S12_00225 [bacterium]|nr:hypothetical protein [bacterium]
MDKEGFAKKLVDKGVSDRMAFKALLEYLRKAPAEDEEFSKFVASQRPEVWKKFTEYVTDGHEYCCGPNTIQDNDSHLVKAYKSMRAFCSRIKWFLKYGE